MSRQDMLGVAVQKLDRLPVATLKMLIDLLEKIVANREWAVALGRFLRRENPWVVTTHGWREVLIVAVIGGIKPYTAFRDARAAVSKGGRKLVYDRTNRYAVGRLMDNLERYYHPSDREWRATLERFTARDLGQVEPFYFSDAFKVVEQRGLVACPLEVALRFAEGYRAQPKGEHLAVPLKLEYHHGIYRYVPKAVLVVGHGDKGRYVEFTDLHDEYPRSLLPLSTELVFLRP